MRASVKHQWWLFQFLFRPPIHQSPIHPTAAIKLRSCGSLASELYRVGFKTANFITGKELMDRHQNKRDKSKVFLISYKEKNSNHTVKKWIITLLGSSKLASPVRGRWGPDENTSLSRSPARNAQRESNHKIIHLTPNEYSLKEKWLYSSKTSFHKRKTMKTFQI